MCSPEPENCTPLKSANCFRFVSQIRVDATTFLSRLHISKTRFLFPVSITTEYKVGVPEFYLYMGFGADLLKNVVTTA